MILEISPEYEDKLVEWLEEYGEDPAVMTFPGFASFRGISPYSFHMIRKSSPKVHNAYGVLLSQFHSKWVKLGFDNFDKPLQPHILYLFKKYIDQYDIMGKLDALEEAKELKRDEIKTTAHYHGDNYKNEPLDGPFKDIFNENTRKRRGREKA